MAKLRSNARLVRSIITFEVASRSRSFTEAAEELGISRVAVSRQIADLEKSLGQSLFIRRHRDVVLTAKGETFASLVNPALERIADAIEKQRSEARTARLTVTVTTAFATYWLMPRLVDFGAQHPDIEINLMVSDRYLDLTAEGIDVAIRYMPKALATEGWMPLFHERIFPVYSPSYRARTALAEPADLLEEKLLDLSGRYRIEAGWRYWFRWQGLVPPEEQAGVQVNTYINMLQAAIDGHGVALAGHPLVDKYLADGSLLRIDGIPSLSRDFYYVKRASDDLDSRSFCSWLRTQNEKNTDSDGRDTDLNGS